MDQQLVPVVRAGPEAAGVRKGVADYRRRLRFLGPLVALLIPAVAFAGAYVLWRLVPCDSGACLHTRAPAWLLAALAVPTALLGGVPFEGGTPRYVVIGTTSVVAWLLLGWLAARRATRQAVASWRDWWREYAWLLLGVWVGVVIALGGVYYIATHNGLR
jgi:hypothetical protein